MKKVTTSQIIQLCDSCFPVGGFVYSYGLESAINGEHINSQLELEQYLWTVMEQAFNFDLPFIDSAFHTSSLSPEWSNILQTYEAMLINPLLHKSSVTMGKNWLRLLSTLYPDLPLQEIDSHIKNQKLSYHYVPLLGLVGGILSISLDQLRDMHLYMTLRDQITALNRLGTVGPTGGQKLLVKLLKKSRLALNSYQTKGYHLAHKSAYLLDIIQLNHTLVYSKLFQN